MTYLRLATEADYPLIMAWRNNPLIYGGFYCQDRPLTWEEHIRWLNSRNADWREFIVMTDHPIGVVTVGQLDHYEPEIGYYIGEVSLWGKGYGREAVRLGLEYIKEYGRGYCHTTILDSNQRSVKLIKSLGFKRLGKAREGESWYQKKLT